MSLTLTPTTPGLSAVSPPRITVIGVGGGGVNAVNNMISGQLRGVNFIAANTDAQQLALSKAETRLQLGPTLTRGLGAGAKPEIGRQSAEEVEDEIRQHLEGVDLVFVTAGMGGGTGTGAAPVVARIAHEAGALTIGVVSKPFEFEGARRGRAAAAGIAELEKYVDTLLVIPNQNLFGAASFNTPLVQAYAMADDVLYSGVRSVTDLMVEAGYQNLDFADVRTVMSGMGKAMMGIGIASAEEDGEDWAITAAERAISNPLLEETSIKGARALLVNVTLGPDMSLIAYNQIMNLIRETANCDDEEINSGFVVDENMQGRVQVSVIATGLDGRTHTAPHSEEPAAPAAPVEAAAPTHTQDDAQPIAEEAPPTPPIHEETPAPEPRSEDAPHHIAGSSAAPSAPNYTLPEREPLEVSRLQEDAPQTGGGLFSRFFRSRPTPPTERKTPVAPTMREDTHPSHPTNSEEDDLNIPTYLRRGPKS
ncbi:MULTISPECIES: cell division protein FtsZ [Bombella]|uniref:Cell division protein FtsZ n=1 Tax=Bombella pollinis TaxID=2967337 RepID=A0ABT3WMA4_9PROT|nr:MULTISPECIES: cell division protein FtsZ [Bombella]MCX5619414.1 cell division protein FtsZ [Bombella pollinis]MUG04887.1 cell division protein FtsZ [Bombella sp. ESL0378]